MHTVQQMEQQGNKAWQAQNALRCLFLIFVGQCCATLTESHDDATTESESGANSTLLIPSLGGSLTCASFAGEAALAIVEFRVSRVK